MQFNNVTCPHCGLLCDDLSLEVNEGLVRLISPSNSPCAAAFEDASINGKLPSAQINGKDVSLDAAIERASEILKNASQPLINGMIADVQASRATVALAEKTGAVMDHANSSTMRPNVAVMQRIGKVKTTLSEARNRADNVIIFGSQVLTRFPRLIERILKPEKSLGSEDTLSKTITILDAADCETSDQIDRHEGLDYHKVNASSLDTIIQAFHSIIQETPELTDDTDSMTRTLVELKNTILSKNYTVLIWNTGLLDPIAAEQTIQTLTLMIKSLMTEIRCVGMPLGGSKGEITANQVVTWQSGVPLPTAFMSGVPIHNPVTHNAKAMLANQEADAMLWLSTYRSTDTPPTTDIPTIVVGHANMQCDNVAVFIPVGVPGIDTRGLACRTDSVATLPLKKIRDINLPNASDIIEKITQQI